MEIVETIGFTYEGISNIEKMMIESYKNAMVKSKYKDQNYNTTLDVPEVTTHVVKNKGAYDNYYTDDWTTRNFVAQALTYSSPHRYFKRTGNVLNGNDGSFLYFTDQIDIYEAGMVSMEHFKFAEVAAWQSYVSSLGLYFLGTAASTMGGSDGWVGALSQIANTVGILGAYTSGAYATKDRVNFSKQTQQALSNAQTVLVYGAWNSDTFGSVVGF
ncbi:hypothetical protein SLU01_34720 [Sporosarcina luteola]|uniref:Uncharacterized protein n=1 Tax=Sporosarcina luteola TaxID=582850 RepID=A0A511ZCI9_9BACL|nr:hypothetical protein [Sporosarcina luteola]GEN85160.1 hypothetical protein SLU01_34720 [Sporosarcina luteola]